MRKKINKIIFGGLLTLLPLATKAQNAIVENPINRNDIGGLVEVVVAFFLRLGSVVVVFMIIYSGFLFVKAQGNDAELSKAKNTLLMTIIGGVILLGARVIAEVVKNTAEGLGVGI